MSAPGSPRNTSRSRYRSPDGRQRPYKSAGRWYAPASVPVPGGDTRKVRGTGATQAAAERNRDRLIADAARDAMQPDKRSRRTVTGWCQHWLDGKVNIRTKTRVGYQRALDRWITPHLGDERLLDVTLEKVEDLHRAVLAQGLSRTVWVNVRTVLRQSFEEAVRRRHLDVNVMLYAPAAAPKKRSDQHLTERQARAVLTACLRTGERARWLTALTLGLRQGEALGLTWEDVELEGSRPTLSVRRTVQRVTGQGLVTSPPKTKKSQRDLHIPAPLAQALREHRTEQRKRALAGGRPWTAQTPVFASPRGTFTDPANDRKAWMALLERAGVPYVKPHAARHTAATLMLSGGADIAVVADALGHASVAVTADVYGHLPREVVGDALASVASRLTG